jgi:hypothetical protein
MKNVVAILFILAAICSHAQNSTSAYRLYVMEEVYKHNFKHHTANALAQPQQVQTHNSMYFIPRYEIPKGSVFCRMEDKLTRATKVWIKVGTNNNK